MKILSIETSCDETAVSIVEARGGFANPGFKVLAHTIASQIDLHRKWGGVVPSLAKREHGKALLPLLIEALGQAKLLKKSKTIPTDKKLLIKTSQILEREPDLSINFLETIPKLVTPKIDAIAVTYGPGLEPALWVGINFAKALSLWWGKPVIPSNHMEGHLLSPLATETSKKQFKKSIKIHFPAIALLVSGGHTEIVLIKDWLKYKVVGKTRDDAAGEAFDKVARLLGLPYPGGPQISKLAESISDNQIPEKYKLPRPMIHSGDFDFSFSGLKTAVLYKIKELAPLSELDKKIFAYEFQEAVLDVLLKKTLAAVEKYQARSVIVGGGVIANKKLQQRLTTELRQIPGVSLLIPSNTLATDNATMIALAAYFNSLKKKYRINPQIKAEGNLSF